MNYFQAIQPHPNQHYLATAIVILFLIGCTPTIQVAASDQPIEVNLNVKIEHEIKIKVDRDIEQLFDNKAVF
ncbi:YnbE family lipoprotein [Photobacterium sp. S4TG1]|uniref:YnbE family lipoprotein n=1 Tax=Photobacterium sp. S4TG1 TaxID=3114587 RepID=UPI002E196A10|nr:YnbE family lipoprotein [Photobacterium sp. S4TG1]